MQNTEPPKQNPEPKKPVAEDEDDGPEE